MKRVVAVLVVLMMAGWPAVAQAGRVLTDMCPAQKAPVDKFSFTLKATNTYPGATYSWRAQPKSWAEGMLHFTVHIEAPKGFAVVGIEANEDGNAAIMGVLRDPDGAGITFMRDKDKGMVSFVAGHGLALTFSAPYSLKPPPAGAMIHVSVQDYQTYRYLACAAPGAGGPSPLSERQEATWAAEQVIWTLASAIATKYLPGYLAGYVPADGLASEIDQMIPAIQLRIFTLQGLQWGTGNNYALAAPLLIDAGHHAVHYLREVKHAAQTNTPVPSDAASHYATVVTDLYKAEQLVPLP